ncbi:MAG: response regulator [Leptolyngbyaceae cyanobacterium]
MKILLADSNQRSLTRLKTELSQHHFVVDTATDGETAWGLTQSFTYDLILLNAVLPKLDGIGFCHRLRASGSLVLVMLMVEAGDRSTVIRGLDSGADDCLINPIDQQELLARMRCLNRRSLSKIHSTLSWGPVSLDFISRQVICNAQIVPVTRKEYQILELLLRSPRQLFTRSEITDRLYTLDDQLPMERTIKTHIHSIRRKLEKVGAIDFIQTQYGYGYRLNPVFSTLPERPANSDQDINQEINQDVDPITWNTWHQLMTTNAQLRQEIEERHRVETELRRSESLLRNAQQAAKMGAWEFDVATMTTFWTEELYHIHGLDPTLPAPSNQEIINLIHPDDHQLHQDQIVKPALQGAFFNVNLRIIRQDGEIRYINARGGPVFDSQGRLIKLTGTTFDITG